MEGLPWDVSPAGGHSVGWCPRRNLTAPADGSVQLRDAVYGGRASEPLPRGGGGGGVVCGCRKFWGRREEARVRARHCDAGTSVLRCCTRLQSAPASAWEAHTPSVLSPCQAATALQAAFRGHLARARLLLSRSPGTPSLPSQVSLGTGPSQLSASSAQDSGPSGPGLCLPALPWLLSYAWGLGPVVSGPGDWEVLEDGAAGPSCNKAEA